MRWCVELIAEVDEQTYYICDPVEIEITQHHKNH